MPADELENFVKYCRDLAVVRFPTLEHEYTPGKVDKEQVQDAFLDLEAMMEEEPPMIPRPPKPVHWYFALRAEEQFFEENGRVPGSKGADVEKDTAAVVKMAKDLMGEYGAGGEVLKEECCQEIVRHGGSQMHNMAALLGGYGAQEVLKILTRQYLPFSHTVVLDGVHCVMGQYSF